MYINCKTFFSFKYGTYSTEEIVKAATECGIESMALTNINNTCDIWDFVEFCQQNRIKPIAGTEVRNNNELMYILLAKNNEGFKEINSFLSQYLSCQEPFPLQTTLSENVFIIYPFGKVAADDLRTNEWIGIQTTEVNKFYGLNLPAYADKYVIRHPVTFQNKTYYNAHRLLRAIDKNTILSKQQKEDIADVHETMLSPSELKEIFSAYPALITNTSKLLDSCTITMDYHTDKNKKIYGTSKEEDRLLLEKLAWEGFYKRFSDNIAAKERVEKELKIINDLGFNAYFLITWDLIQYAKSRGFFYVGRGSGGNSIVAFCLQITDVDPIELDLYFERFLNPHRSIPPDFDIDFSYKDRDEIIRYIFKRYGKEHVCLLGMYSTFQQRLIIRELGKVFGLPKEEIDELENSNFKDDKIQRQIQFYGNLIKDFPNHLSIHAGGMLISDEPIYTYAATELPPKGFYTSQIDMFIAEKIGLFKLDILSQRGLGHIKESVEIIKQNQNVSIDIHDIEQFKSDKKVAARIKAADTIGCFYVESPGMRQLLKKLRCDDYVTLVAASSIIRPGVAQSGMMRQYIYRYHHPEEFEYLHPTIKELLKETYGIMVYQEDVIKIAHHFVGLDMAEADVLRRAMNGKYRGHKYFEEIKEKFFRLCKEKNYTDELSKEVWRQLESFGSFSFSKAHSASFAVESYQSLYLKTYFPLEFMVAVINNFGGFYSRELYFHELKRLGAIIQLPCVNTSLYHTSIRDTTVTIGFVHLDGLEFKLAEEIIHERQIHGAYKHLQDFIERLRPGMEQLNILIRIGAFRFSGKSKKELLWEANFLQKRSAKHSMNNIIFKEEPVVFNLPMLVQHPLDDAIDEIELLGFPLCNIFELADEDVSKYTLAEQIPIYLLKEVTVLGYLVASKSTRTLKGETMFFHTFIDAAGNWIDTVFFPPINQFRPIQGKGIYQMKGKVVEEFGAYSLEVNYCKKIGLKNRKAI